MGIGGEQVEFLVGPVSDGNQPGTVPSQARDSLRILRSGGHKEREGRRPPEETPPFASHPYLLAGEGSPQEGKVFATGEPESHGSVRKLFVSRKHLLEMRSVSPNLPQGMHLQDGIPVAESELAAVGGPFRVISGLACQRTRR